jgi:hypothetical protein
MSEKRDDILPPEEAPDASSNSFANMRLNLWSSRGMRPPPINASYISRWPNIWQETAIRWERDLVKDQEKVRRDSTAGPQ